MLSNVGYVQDVKTGSVFVNFVFFMVKSPKKEAPRSGASGLAREALIYRL